MDELYTVEEAAAKFKVTVKTMRDWLRLGKIRASKIGKAWRIREQDLEAFADAHINREADESERR